VSSRGYKVRADVSFAKAKSVHSERPGHAGLEGGESQILPPEKLAEEASQLSSRPALNIQMNMARSVASAGAAGSSRLSKRWPLAGGRDHP